MIEMYILINEKKKKETRDQETNSINSPKGMFNNKRLNENNLCSLDESYEISSLLSKKI
jgi:hypothetical protein